ncbi:DUF928 domain-containing protein [Desmonostoc muscorum LEGE 12446]|uniref:DUF928 domain-containing protein n=1 Tax=Desmonostoc muscorum LEGE 12446 TaxID=1828758 RepID=A0A8J6ZJ19_DESMC|nr:DUF928 domain-containing protein [Desmonostoc muscorum]MCF2147044.1 DUF928 domain-containing protein [Desmonostoc muscorum LEGE 12446]
MSQLFNQAINLKLASGCVLGLFLFLTPVVTANAPRGDRQPASDYTTSGGGRGCSTSVNEIPLTLLAPKTYIGYTASTRPTFVGYLSSSHEIEFQIFEFVSNNTVKAFSDPIKQEISPGIFQVSLPESYPKLTVGKKYFWQVAISCSGDDLVERAEFMVVEMPSTVENKLLTTTNALQKSNTYAAANLWYEALAEALNSATPGKLGQVGSNLVQEFAKYESARVTENEELVKKRIQHLQTIADQER